jgi:hypothetical protein
MQKKMAAANIKVATAIFLSNVLARLRLAWEIPKTTKPPSWAASLLFV